MSKEAGQEFTITYPCLVREIYTDSTIFNYFDHSIFIETKRALWDTGATTTGINISLVKKLKLIPFRKVSVQGAHGKKL